MKANKIQNVLSCLELYKLPLSQNTEFLKNGISHKEAENLKIKTSLILFKVIMWHM